MTTRVTPKCDSTNCKTGLMVVGVVSGGSRSTSLAKPPFSLDYWVHSDLNVVCREASEQDVIDHTPPQVKS